MASSDSSSQFGPVTAFIYLFNFVVGTGVLALPSVLISGGWLLGGIFITIVAFLSYMSLTFVVESMAATNALIFLEREPKKAQFGNTSVNAIQISQVNDVKQPLLDSSTSVADCDIFAINERTELSEMASRYYNRTGLVLFFSLLIVYMYGDGVIASTVIVRSLVTFIFGEDEPAWAFGLLLSIFFIFILPFCFFDFQKTKGLQMVTMVIRNASLVTIIFLAFRAALQKDQLVKQVRLTNFGALPNLFGGAVYSFMCHQSLPGIITPIANKKNIMKLTGAVFGFIYIIYMILFIGCLLAFGADVRDPVTFNFPPQVYGFIGDALFLFPVFTLSSSFPMILITLRNNLDILFQLTYGGSKSSQAEKGDLAKQRQIILTLISVVPPVVCAFLAQHFGLSVDSLVGTSGAFAGCIVMFFIPASFVYLSRKVVKETIENSKAPMKYYSTENAYSSPFKGTKWVVALMGWTVVAMVFNAVEKLASAYSK
ncbi:hypothetical protein R1sor_008613 [Riccia sorocarpa]|uniref:Amino acid transporter transmembrane domain-containing protein n=1 Tax=Riccia sorocarpa TaxID=122646 RepID=A0ABD3HXG2_9MARC